jgi:hypothetical protein
LISGWGRNNWVYANIISPSNSLVRVDLNSFSTCIARGLGRSYGDSSLAQNVICLNYKNLFISFDQNTGILECESGISLFELINVFIIYVSFRFNHTSESTHTRRCMVGMT